MNFIFFLEDNGLFMYLGLRPLILITAYVQEDSRQINQRKLMIMHKTLHPRDDIDRLYMSRKEGERGFDNIKDCFDGSIKNLRTSLKRAKKD